MIWRMVLWFQCWRNNMCYKHLCKRDFPHYGGYELGWRELCGWCVMEKDEERMRLAMERSKRKAAWQRTWEEQGK